MNLRHIPVGDMESWRNPGEEQMRKRVGKSRLRKGLKDCLQAKACHAPSVCVVPQEGLKQAEVARQHRADWQRGRERSDSAGDPDNTVGEDLGLTS